MRERVRNALPWVAAGLVATGLVYHREFQGPHTLDPSAAAASGPARDVALPGGGVSDGSRCGAKAYHYFPVSTVTDSGGMLPGTPAGPAMVLGAYGAEQGAHSPGTLTISFQLATGSTARSLDLSAPLGAQGVAVEIEGPDGLVGGAHNLPFTLDDPSARTQSGKVRVGIPGGVGVELRLPAAILCPGQDVTSVVRGLMAPVDSTGTITGQPRYTLTVSVSDPAVTELRRALGSTAAGPVLAANNLNPE